jgi:hypothetical protein
MRSNRAFATWTLPALSQTRNGIHLTLAFAKVVFFRRPPLPQLPAYAAHVIGLIASRLTATVPLNRYVSREYRPLPILTSCFTIR